VLVVIEHGSCEATLTTGFSCLWLHTATQQVENPREVSAYLDGYDTWQPVVQTILNTLTQTGNGDIDQVPASISQVIFRCRLVHGCKPPATTD